MASWVRIQRRNQMTSRLGDFDVTIDGNYMGSLSVGQTRTFEIAPGSHWANVQGWMQSSNRTNFDVTNGQTIDLFFEIGMFGLKLSRA